MPFAWFVALRYLREGRTQTVLIFAGAAVGVAVIVYITALINGLQATLIERTLGLQPDVTLRRPDEAPRRFPRDDGAAVSATVVQSTQRLRDIPEWPEILRLVERSPDVVAVAPSAVGAGFAARGGASRAIALRGVDPEGFLRIVDLPRYLVRGTYRLDSSDVLIGTKLAADLGVAVGEKIRLTSAENRSDVFTVVGLFDLGIEDLNERWVFVSLRSAQTLLDLLGGVTVLELKVRALFEAEDVAQTLAARTGLEARSWMQTNQQLLLALRAQNTSRYIIATFVVIAVALGIASVLVVSVVQKSREIGILRAMGASRGRITRIFLAQGAVVGAVGALLGSLLGIGIAGLFQRLATNPDGSPAFTPELRPGLFIGAGVLAIATGLLAAIVPARRAARLDPATVIRSG